MLTYECPEYETQPSVGQVVNVYDPAAKDIVAARITGAPSWYFSEIDQANYATYSPQRIRFASHGNFPRMEDGGCAVCSGCGCEQCNYSGGY